MAFQWSRVLAGDQNPQGGDRGRWQKVLSGTCPTSVTVMPFVSGSPFRWEGGGYRVRVELGVETGVCPPEELSPLSHM